MLASILMAALLLSGCISSSNSENAVPEKVDVSIKVIVNEKTIVDQTISVAKGTSALEALQKVALVETKPYSLGKFIVGIAGINSTGADYWAFYINKEYAQVGADSYKIENPAELMFKLEKITNFS